MKFTVIILTKNEEKHIERCVKCVRKLTNEILVVDSGSNDRTTEIAKLLGARVLTHHFVNYAKQFNWALNQVDKRTEWILRIDADEFLTTELTAEIGNELRHAPPDVKGFSVLRSIVFQGRKLRFGGVNPIRVVRLFRLGFGQCEDRWMDEHIEVDGKVADLNCEIIDENLNSLTWWTEKHNWYASREALDLLNLKYGFMQHDSVAQKPGGSQAATKRWIKESIYSRLPGGFRAFVYFFYRYVFLLGMLDGKEGRAFHFLQGFWYRYLVDAKVAEVERYMIRNNCEITEAIGETLSLEIQK